MTLPRMHCSLAPSGIGILRGTRWLLVLLTITSSYVAVWMWEDCQGLTEQAEQYEQAAERVGDMNRQFAADTARTGIVLSQVRAQALTREVLFANRLLATRAFSWTSFLNDLEEAVPKHLSISAVEVNFKESVIKLTGNALTLKDVTAFVDGLETHPAFHTVMLVQHKTQENSQNHSSPDMSPIEFALTVGYRPAH